MVLLATGPHSIDFHRKKRKEIEQNKSGKNRVVTSSALLSFVYSHLNAPLIEIVQLGNSSWKYFLFSKMVLFLLFYPQCFMFWL